MLRNFITQILFSLIPALTFAADSKVGLEVFALRSSTFKCQEFLNATANVKSLHLGVLWDSFGKNNDCLVRLLRRPNLKSVRVHLVNEVCMRNGNCDDQSLFNVSKQRYKRLVRKKRRSVFRKIKNSVLEADSFINDLPACYISPGLESNLTVRQADPLIKYVQKFTNCKVVWNPNKHRGQSEQADLTEYHNAKTSLDGNCLSSTDGRSVIVPASPFRYHRNMKLNHFAQFKTKHKSCEINYIWSATFSNCISKNYFIPPSERYCKKIGKWYFSGYIKHLEGLFS